MGGIAGFSGPPEPETLKDMARTPVHRGPDKGGFFSDPKVNPAILLSSGLGIGGAKAQRLLDICLHLKAGIYFSGAAARDYLEMNLFTDRGIAIIFHEYDPPVYPQLFGNFVPYLSVIDLLMNVGPKSQGGLAPSSPHPRMEQ